MPEYLVIRLRGDEQPVEWLLVDSNGTRRSGVSSGTLEQAAAEVVDRPVIALVPAVDVLTTTVHIPVRSASKIKVALPFALEENLADDVTDMHFAVGPRQENDRLPVAVVSHEAMAAWLTRLHDVGVQPAIMAAANHGLAKIPGTLSLLIDDETIMFNDGADADFVVQDVKPSDALVISGHLGEQQDDDGANSGHLMVFCTPETDASLSHDWLALRHELDSVDINVLPDGVLAKLAVTVASGCGVNLLQGRYGKKSEYSTLLKPWKTAALLLLGLAFVGITTKGVDYYQLQRQQAALKTQFISEYRSLRPDDSREILDPRSTVDSLRRSLGAATAPQVFLPSLRELGTAIAANSSAKVEAISYRAGVVDLRLTAPDVATLDNIQKSVSASGRFRATIQSTDQVADKINGRIQIREAGP